jgi:hypothetical protein
MTVVDALVAAFRRLPLQPAAQLSPGLYDPNEQAMSR